MRKSHRTEWFQDFLQNWPTYLFYTEEVTFSNIHVYTHMYIHTYAHVYTMHVRTINKKEAIKKAMRDIWSIWREWRNDLIIL